MTAVHPAGGAVVGVGDPDRCAGAGRAAYRRARRSGCGERAVVGAELPEEAPPGQGPCR